MVTVLLPLFLLIDYHNKGVKGKIVLTVGLTRTKYMNSAFNNYTNLVDIVIIFVTTVHIIFIRITT